jgi:hypothetical protein
VWPGGPHKHCSDSWRFSFIAFFGLFVFTFQVHLRSSLKEQLIESGADRLPESWRHLDSSLGRENSSACDEIPLPRKLCSAVVVLAASCVTVAHAAAKSLGKPDVWRHSSPPFRPMSPEECSSSGVLAPRRQCAIANFQRKRRLANLVLSVSTIFPRRVRRARRVTNLADGI